MRDNSAGLIKESEAIKDKLLINDTFNSCTFQNKLSYLDLKAE